MGQLSHRVDIPFPLFDADNHLYEAAGGMTKYAKEYKDIVQYSRSTDGQDRSKRADLNYIPNPTVSVVAKPVPGRDFKFGNPTARARRAGREPMRPSRPLGPSRASRYDELGVDRSLMFPTLASLIEVRLPTTRCHPRLIHALNHGWTRCGASTPGRISLRR
jgi:hypothetical protein